MSGGTTDGAKTVAGDPMSAKPDGFLQLLVGLISCPRSASSHKSETSDQIIGKSSNSVIADVSSNASSSASSKTTFFSTFPFLAGSPVLILYFGCPNLAGLKIKSSRAPLAWPSLINLLPALKQACMSQADDAKLTTLPCDPTGWGRSVSTSAWQGCD